MTESFGYGAATAGTGATGDHAGPVDDSVERVGQDDADADAARSGADVDDGAAWDRGLELQEASTDTDGEVVGTADADADAIRSGVDPDDL